MQNARGCFSEIFLKVEFIIVPQSQNILKVKSSRINSTLIKKQA